MTNPESEIFDIKTTVALIEERLRVETGIIRSLVRLVKGDGNGEKGLIHRLMRLGMAVEQIADRHEEFAAELKEIRRLVSSLTVTSRVKWKVILSAVGQISAVIGSIAAVVIALWGK